MSRLREHAVVDKAVSRLALGINEQQSAPDALDAAPAVADPAPSCFIMGAIEHRQELIGGEYRQDPVREVGDVPSQQVVGARVQRAIEPDGTLEVGDV